MSQGWNNGGFHVMKSTPTDIKTQRGEPLSPNETAAQSVFLG